MSSLRRWLEAYKNFKPFSDGEAWGLFRLAAIGEAVGWTLLISGIIIDRYFMHGNDMAVRIAGQFHGTIFLIYIAGVAVLSPSQGWSLRRTLFAGIASVPPYGSILFEQWEARRRHRESLSMHLSRLSYCELIASSSSD